MEVNNENDNAPKFKVPNLPGAATLPSPDTKNVAAKPTELADADQKDAENKESKPVPETNQCGGDDGTAKQQPDQLTPLKTASPAEIAKAKAVPFPYQEPSWGGLPGSHYYLEVLKNGTIVDTVRLENKSQFSIGRLVTCDIVLEHPSISRYHAVLQFKNKGSPEKPVGFYLYDLDSTHGTFHNKNKCFPKTYYRLRVGHMLKFGGSTRTFLLQGPEEDSEEESDLSVTELKAMAQEKVKKKQEEERQKKTEESESEDISKSSDSEGISWGMGDDAEEFPDMDQEFDCCIS